MPNLSRKSPDPEGPSASASCALPLGMPGLILRLRQYLDAGGDRKLALTADITQSYCQSQRNDHKPREKSEHNTYD